MVCESCGNSLIHGAVFCPYCSQQVKYAKEFDDYAYEAFISYRHHPDDRRQALYLQRSIEGFIIPRPLRRDGGPSRLGKCFRDEDELPTAESLPDQIRDALMRSRFLIVICSRRTCESEWVLREVELFASLHGRDRIRLVLIDGEPDESFPPLLLKRLEVGLDGSVTEKNVEPLAADFRDSRRRKLKLERLRIIAPIIGCGFDDLRQRQRQRQLRLAATVATAITVGSIAFGSFSLYQQRQIEQNFRNTQIRESELLADRALELAESGDRYQAIQVALAALPSGNEANDRPLVPAAQVALEKALGVYPSGQMFENLYSVCDVSSNNRAHAYSESGLMAFVDVDGLVRIIEMDGGDEICSRDVRNTCGIATSISVWDDPPMMVFIGDQLIYGNTSDERNEEAGDSNRALIACFDARTGELLWQTGRDALHSCRACTLSHDGQMLATISGHESQDMDTYTRTVSLINTENGSLIQDYRLSSHDSNDNMDIAFDEDDKTLALVADERCATIDLNDGNAHQVTIEDNEIYETDVSLTWVDGKIAVLFHEDGTYRREYCLQVYDSKLNCLWKRSGSTFTSYKEATSSVSRTPTFAICGAVGERQGRNRTIVALLNSHLQLLDENTGDDVCALRRDAPFVACRIFGDVGNETIGALTADGEFIMRHVSQINMDNWDDYSGFDSSFVPACGKGDITRNEQGLFLVGWTEFPTKYKLSRLVGDSSWGTFLEDAQDYAPLTPWNVGKETYLAGFSDGSLGIFSANNPDKALIVDMDQLPEIDAKDTASLKLVPSFQESSVFVSGTRLHEDGGEDSYIAYELSAKTGEILRQIDLGEEVRDFEEISLEDGGRALFVKSYREVRITSFDGLSDIAIPLEGFDSANDALYARNRIVVFTGNGAVLLDGRTGKQIACDLDSFDGYTCYRLSADGALLVVAYDGGSTRLFDVETGSLLWESDSSVGGVNHLAFAPETNDVFQQDETGTLSLLSQTDGSVLAVSASSLPHIFESWELDNPSFLAVHYDNSRMTWLNQESVAVIDLNSETFGQTSVIDCGTWLSGDEKLAVLREPQLDKRYSVIDHYDLDELIDRANQITEGHELTDAERNQFHLGFPL